MRKSSKQINKKRIIPLNYLGGMAITLFFTTSNALAFHNAGEVVSYVTQKIEQNNTEVIMHTNKVVKITTCSDVLKLLPNSIRQNNITIVNDLLQPNDEYRLNCIIYSNKITATFSLFKI